MHACLPDGMRGSKGECQVFHGTSDGQVPLPSVKVKNTWRGDILLHSIPGPRWFHANPGSPRRRTFCMCAGSEFAAMACCLPQKHCPQAGRADCMQFSGTKSRRSERLATQDIEAQTRLMQSTIVALTMLSVVSFSIPWALNVSRRSVVHSIVRLLLSE